MPSGYGAHSAGYGGTYGTGYPMTQRVSRPGSVITASILSWIGGATVLLFAFLFVVVRALDPGEFGIVGEDADLFQRVLTGMGWGTIVLGLLVLVPSVFAFMGAGWARIVLLVLGSLVGLATIVTIAIGAFPMVFVTLWIALATGLYFTPGANAWFRHKRQARSGLGAH